MDGIYKRQGTAIQSDWQGAISALVYYEVKSRLVRDCLQKLYHLDRQNKITQVGNLFMVSLKFFFEIGTDVWKNIFNEWEYIKRGKE